MLALVLTFLFLEFDHCKKNPSVIYWGGFQILVITFYMEYYDSYKHY